MLSRPALLLAASLWGTCSAGCMDPAPTPPPVPPELIPGQWMPLPDVIGGPIQEIAVAELGGRIYVLGGFNEQLGIEPTLRAYHVEAGTWELLTPLPMPVHHANLAAAGGKLYVLGALVGPSFQATGASWVYDPGTNTWEQITPMEATFERGAAAVGVIEGMIYLAGGLRDGAPLSDIVVYDSQNDVWNYFMSPLPAARDHMVGAVVGGVFYVIGGRDRGVLSNRVDAYDPVTDIWTPHQPLPTPRAGMAAAVLGNHIVVVGGEGSDRPSGVFDQVESYDAATGEWSSLAPMRTPRHGMGAAAYQDAIYVPGGAVRAGFAAVATFEALMPEFTP